MKLFIALFIGVSLSSYAQVKVSYFGDTLKGDIKKMTEYTFNWMDTIKSVYTCDVSERKETTVFYSSHDELLGKWLVIFDDNGRIIEKGLYDSDGTSCQMSIHKYGLHDREIDRTDRQFRCPKCNSLSDRLSGGITEWVYGVFNYVTSYKYEYDSRGRVVKTTENFSILSESTDTIDKSVEITYYKYDNNDSQAIEIKKENFRAMSGIADTTVEITEYKYDGKGNKVEEDVLTKTTAAINNYRLKNWYSNGKEVTSKTLFRYDTLNNLVERKGYFFLPENHYSQHHPGMAIGSGSEYTYDSLNNMATNNFYYLYRLEDSSEIKEVELTSKNEKREEDRKQYDEKGNVTKVTNGATTILRRDIEYF